MFEFITANWQDMILVITSLVTVASVIANLTPSETDNKIVDALRKIVDVLALNIVKPVK